MKPLQLRRQTLRTLSAAIVSIAISGKALAQPAGDTSRPVGRLAEQDLKGRIIEDVEIRGNTQVSTAVIRNLIRTRKGEAFDPATVAEDYQRVFTLRKFSNVEAKVEPTEKGVIVAFVVTEQKQIRRISFRGNSHVDEPTLRGAIDLHAGEAVDTFRISIARGQIENVYRDKNFPLAHVTVADAPLAQSGEVVFNVIEGPLTRVRKTAFKGAHSFSSDRLRDQIKTGYWIPIFRSGKFEPQQVEDDVASLRTFYLSKGFFDVRVGRKIIWSADQSEIEIDFVIEEGPRYVIDKVTFIGNTGVNDADLRAAMKGLEGRAYDKETIQRDIREMVRAYSKRYGYIYQGPSNTDRDYLHIEAKEVFKNQPGRIELVYAINEGKEFNVGNIFVKGNYKSQDKLVLREFRDLVPGKKFNSAEMQDAGERLRRLPYFSSVTMTPIGDDPAVRDMLVEVTEQRTASFNIGAGVNSNGGIGGNITYEQRNFDIGNPPPRWSEFFSDRAFTGAGQVFRASIEPGTQQSNASIRFSEPWLFDQPYGFSNELYLRTRIREHYDERRIGDTVTLSKRFDYIWTGLLSLRAEQVKIGSVEDLKVRAPEILAAQGKSDLTSAALTIRRDTTNPGLFPDRGSVTTGRWESYGALGGDYEFQKFTLGWDGYQTIHEDLLDRKTVLGLHANAGYIVGDSIFFERFYGGGIGSVRGFRFRGISPRSGRGDDPVGGDFILTGTVQVDFPLVGETLRGVVFSDVGTVESDVRIGAIRSSVGTGVRLVLPFLGQTPLAIDFAIPITQDRKDDTQLISFSFGLIQ